MSDRSRSPEKLPSIVFEGSPFCLAQPFEPAGDQPAAIAALVEGLADGLSFQTLLGVTGSGKTYTMANVIARAGRPARAITFSSMGLPPASSSRWYVGVPSARAE